MNLLVSGRDFPWNPQLMEAKMLRSLAILSVSALAISLGVTSAQSNPKGGISITPTPVLKVVQVPLRGVPVPRQRPIPPNRGDRPALDVSDALGEGDGDAFAQDDRDAPAHDGVGDQAIPDWIRQLALDDGLMQAIKELGDIFQDPNHGAFDSLSAQLQDP